jgi:two-component system, NarL family, sensor kinase
MAEPRDDAAPGSAAPPEAMREIVDRVRRITRENERLFQRLIEGESRFRGLAKAVWKVQEDERRRLARELHDGLGQTLTALKNQLERLERKAAAPEGGVGEEVAAAGELRAGLADSVELARAALNETRELSRLLRPPVLDDLGLLPALAWLARTLEQRTGLAVAVDADGVDGRLEPDLETLVFRLVQEALTNVLKHAAVPAAEVHLARRGGALELRVADAGAGFDAAAALDGGEGSPGTGLRSMRDRVELFGGRLEVWSAPGRGTTVAVMLPLADAGAP